MTEAEQAYNVLFEYCIHGTDTPEEDLLLENLSIINRLIERDAPRTEQLKSRGFVCPSCGYTSLGHGYCPQCGQFIRPSRRR